VLLPIKVPPKKQKQNQIKTNMNVNLKATVQELKDLINTIKTKQDSSSPWTGTEKADFEKRLNHVLDKSNPRHSNLTQDLDLDLKDIENLDKTIGAEKLRTDTEIKKLGDEKTQLEKDIQAKDALLKQKNEEIGDKLTSDLITKLDALSKGVDENGKVKIDETTLTGIKNCVEEIKTKGTKPDLTELTKKLTDLANKADEIKSEAQKGQPQGTNYWSIGACGGTAVCALLLVFLIFKPKSPKIISESETE
jgi:hypothetical protein